MPVGNKGFVGVKKETTWGEKVVGDNEFYLPFVSETFIANIEEVLSAAQRGVPDEPKSYQGERAFAGDVVIEVRPASLGAILRSAFDIPDTDPAGTTETELEDCEDAWNELVDGGVISGVDASDYKKGTKSVKIQVTTGVAVDAILASGVISPTADMHLDTALKFWIKSDIACDASDLAIRISESVNCGIGGTYKDVLVPALEAGVWKECSVTMTGMTDFDAVISIGLILKVDKGEMIIHIDDIRRVIVGTAANAIQHIFIPRLDDFHVDCPLNPYTFEVYRDQGDSFQFLGGVVNALALNFSTTDKILKATCGIISKNLGDVAKTSVALETTNPFLWNNAVISIGDSPVVNNDILNFGINYNNACKARYTLNNTVIPRSIIRDGFRITAVNFVIDFIDRTEYNKFLDGSEQAFQVKFEGAVCDDPVKYTLQLDMPKVQYKAFPINIGGPTRLTCAVTAKANYDATAGVLHAIKAKLINLQPSY